MSPSPISEAELRIKLGIPPEAQRVLILAESSHWDPNWLYTSTQYYERYVRANLDAALSELAKEPARIYSVECVFFLRLYWEDRPARQAEIRALVNSGRLRMTSSGVTTADTILPGAEAILRDWLLGQEWLTANGMHVQPDLAYFPDSFGYSQSLPSLLRAGGFSRTGITRMDGMYFLGCDLDSPSHYPKPGSSAERLLKVEKTQDFIWRDQSGAQVLCHWNAFTYGQGDMLAATGISRVYIVPWYVNNPSEGNVRAKINSFVRQLAPLSRTPYLFCPIGYDFVPPIPNLLALIERYNRKDFARSGVWVVNAGLDDYLTLVDFYRERLPVVEMDPNPYWTGFYSSRPALKQLSFALAERLRLAETLSALQPYDPTKADEALRGPWWTMAVSNHHDFITGTSKDAVVQDEQKPWLESAIRDVDGLLSQLEAPTAQIPAVPASPAPALQRDGAVLRIQTPTLRLELNEAQGGCITSLTAADGRSLLGGLSNDVIAYRDTGGLWRMGHEFPGGKLEEIARTSQTPAQVRAMEKDGLLALQWTANLPGTQLEQSLWITAHLPGLRLRSSGTAPAGQTFCPRFETGLACKTLWMDEPGGLVRRPTEKHYQPTYWPFQTFARLEGSPRGDVLFLRGMPGAGAYRPGGSFELTAQRNATQETAYGFLNFPGMPVKGIENERFSLDYGLLFLASGEQPGERAQAVLRLGDETRSPGQRWAELLKAAFAIEPAEVEVLALKRAAHRPGLILRIYHPTGSGQTILIRPTAFKATRALLCDAREREIEPLPTPDGAIQLTTRGTISTLYFEWDA